MEFNNKKTLFIGLIILIFLIGCTNPEWKIRNFPTELAYQDYIKDSIEKNQIILWADSYNKSEIISSYYFENKGYGEGAPDNSTMLSISKNGIVREYFYANKTWTNYYKIDFQNAEIWDGAVYGKGLRINLIDNEGKKTEVLIEYAENDFSHRNAIRQFMHFSDGTSSKDAIYYSETPNRGFFWDYLKRNFPKNYKSVKN